MDNKLTFQDMVKCAKALEDMPKKVSMLKHPDVIQWQIDNNVSDDEFQTMLDNDDPRLKPRIKKLNEELDTKCKH
jgi:hypothetical protein